MERKLYSIYKLTSPSGRSYVGFTGQDVAERWRQHVNRAIGGAQHPLCNAIRKYGAETFKIETIAIYSDVVEALEAEVAGIAALNDAYNLSPGGDFDHGAGAERFRELLRDPEWRADYGLRLSEALKNSARYQSCVPEILEVLADWRRKNPVLVYKNSTRALRIGASKHGRKKLENPEPKRLPRTPKGKAAKLHKSIKSREAAKRKWANLTEDERTELCSRISKTVSEVHSRKTAEEKTAHALQLAEARKSVDHTVRKARQAEALKEYWTPERRAAFGEKVKKRMAAKREAASENV